MNFPADDLSPVTIAIEKAILAIPLGKVSTYGILALAAGYPTGARQVARVLHSRSRIAGLPWHRVLGKGPRSGTARISLTGAGFDEQAALLRSEGVIVDGDGLVDFVEFGCTPDMAGR